MGREPLIIAVVGPESTGKTTLAQQLALHFDGALAEEYSREYLHSIGRPYLEEDLVAEYSEQQTAVDPCSYNLTF
jgi:nicotinamide riboside kinase